MLAVFAHPDDESFGPGGTLALYAQRGVDVQLLCATRGESGDVITSGAAEGRPVAEVRENELRCAAAELGISQVHLLDYRDSGMPGTPDNEHPMALAQAPREEVAAEVTHLIREFRPQVVITFDPIGGYRHPDHIAMHRATVEAFAAAPDPKRYPDGLPPYRPAKLYYSTFPRRRLRLLTWLSPLFGRDPRKWGRNEDINLVEIASHQFPIHAQINVGSVADRKRAATRCHQSQLDGGPPTNPIMQWLLRLGGDKETFMRAHPPANRKVREEDLFEGVEALG
jgi:N-acetyl-1-D-myo-inositol-2-amino-2-deoxy-alpha-D-glucopyranoside deacetylase/mycothiol S-conjugate amidase